MQGTQSGKPRSSEQSWSGDDDPIEWARANLDAAFIEWELNPSEENKLRLAAAGIQMRLFREHPPT